MRRRQTIPRQWLVVAEPSAAACAGRVPRGSGVLLLVPLSAKQMLRLRMEARRRGLTVVVEGSGRAERVHNPRELTRASLARTPMILLSPLYPTRSHPDWSPMPRMRAAALARLGGRKLLALGGMDARKFDRIRRLGFQGWAGISAFRT
jgi:thiamine-phosphate pyrophosphorylase